MYRDSNNNRPVVMGDRGTVPLPVRLLYPLLHAEYMFAIVLVGYSATSVSR